MIFHLVADMLRSIPSWLWNAPYTGHPGPVRPVEPERDHLVDLLPFLGAPAPFFSGPLVLARLAGVR